MKRLQYKKAQPKKAQQLIEFLLVVPFMVIILGVLTEYAYALNINMTINEGLKMSTASIYSEIKPNMNANTIRAKVLSDFTSYLNANNVPINPENKINVGYGVVGQTAVFMASYTYIPAFTLPNVFFKIMPDEFNFFTTTAVPSAFLGGNITYNSSLDSTKLDKIWSTTADFSTQSSFDASKNGIMKTDDPKALANGGRNSMIFLFPDLIIPTSYYLIHWDGTFNNCVFNSNTGLVSGADCGAYSGGTFLSYLQGNNYYNIIFLHDDEPPSKKIEDLNGYWNPSGDSNLTPTADQGVLKRALNLTKLSSSLSIGNYDNLSVSVYNSSVSSGNDYNVKYFGSMVFVASSDDTSKIIVGNAPSKNYNFTN